MSLLTLSYRKKLITPLFFALPTLFAGGVVAAAEYRIPDPLPPPSELIEEYDNSLPAPEILPAGESAEETKRALQPPQLVNAPAAPAYQPSAPAYSAPPPVAIIPNDQPQPRAVAAAPQRRVPNVAPMRISEPSMFMPGDYYNLPMDDEGIPGVLVPEIDPNFYQTPYAGAGASGRPTARPAHQGLSVRQLEPFFALAKGSEAAAVDAAGRNDNATQSAQLANAVRAYAEIIANADASSEAREEAWYGVARCEYRRGNWWKAFEALERSFPEYYERPEIEGRVKLEMFIGERLWRLAGQPAADAVVNGEQLSGYQAASRVYAAAIFNQPSAQDTPLALLRRGDAAALEGDWDQAVKFYRQTIDNFPESEPAMQARPALAEAIFRQESKVYPESKPQTRMREVAREDVGSIMDDVERQKDKLSPEAAERRQKAVSMYNENEAADKLRHAKDYLKNVRVRKSRDAAVFLLGDVVSRYPSTPQAQEAAEILRGLGIEPPMVLSDGSNFPITRGWSGRDVADPMSTAEPSFSGGSVRLEGQPDIDPAVLPPSPTRETVYEPLPEPTTVNGN